MQKLHAQIQEQQSLRQLELAKSTNIDKLVNKYIHYTTESDTFDLSSWFAQYTHKMQQQ